MRLNKFLSEAGMCSRREADRLVEMCIRDRVWIFCKRDIKYYAASLRKS